MYRKCGGRQSSSWTKVAVAPHKTSNTSWKNDFSTAALCRALVLTTMSTLLPRTTLPAIWQAMRLRVAWMNCIWAAETGFCTKWCTSDEQTPRPPSSAHHKSCWPSYRCNSFIVPLAIRCRRVTSSNLSTQLRRTRCWNTESLTVPATVADPKRSLDSEQISPVTIAHHTVYEKTPNFQQSHVCQWGAQPYLVGPLSRLMGKPPLRHGCQRMSCLYFDKSCK